MKVLVLMLLVYTHTSFGQTKNFEINKKMVDIAKAMRELAPLVFHKKEFFDKKNEKKIDADLGVMIKSFKQVQGHFSKKAVTYQVAYKVMTDHLEDSREVFKSGNKEFSQIMIRSSFNLCMSCHTQDHERRKLFGGTTRSQFDSDYAYAEYNFMTRNYSQALRYYKVSLDNEMNKSAIQETPLVLKRILTLYAQVFKDPGQGKFYFQQLMKNDKTPQLVKSDLTEWIKGFDRWIAEKGIKEPKTWQEVEALAKKFLVPHKARSPFPIEGIDQVTYYRLRGLLDDYLDKNLKSDQMPQILYWLALSDKALNFDIFFSLSNLYLKECMNSYPESPTAKQCFDEFEDQLVFSYSGSSGTNIPHEEKKELEAFRSKIWPKKTKN